ncbi:WD repeat-containing protein 93 [Discoglossus pictus]
MPVYIRKGPLEIPPGSEKNWTSIEEEDCFLRDPNLIIDQLPQPYRMINRTVELLIDQALEIITIREQKREAEKLKAKICVYEPSAEIQITKRVHCMAAGGPDTYLFVGLSDGLGVYSLPDYKWTCGWEDAEIEIYSIVVCHVKNHIYFIGTVDDMGIARLFCFYEDTLILSKVINEPDDISKRTSTVQFQISLGGEYIGVLLEGNGECCLEVYRLPKDSWLKELEQSLGTVSAITAASSTALPTRQTTPSQAGRGIEPLAAETSEMASVVPSVTEIKLSPPLLVMKIKPPKPISGSSFKCPLEAVQKSEENSVFGTGQNHMISAHQWEQQEEIFSSMFQMYLNSDTEAGEWPRHTLFHFLQSGKILQRDPERSQAVLPNAICVHWTGCHNLLLYLLNRPAKDKADVEPKPDTVWPCASAIRCSAVSSCISYLALGLENGTLTVWDIKYSGFPLTVVALPDDRSIRSLHFLEYSSANKDLVLNGIPFTPRTQILVWCTDNSLYLMTAERGKETTLVLLQESPEDSDDQISAVVPVHSFPNVILLCFRNGRVELVNSSIRESMCRFGLPLTHAMASPWQPVYALDSENLCFFLKGNEKMSADEIVAATNGMCSLFAFRLNDLPLMESLTQTQQGTTAPKQNLLWEQKCEIMLQERLQTSSERKKQIAESWSLLRRHAADLTQQAKHNR